MALIFQSAETPENTAFVLILVPFVVDSKQAEAKWVVKSSAIAKRVASF
jgi:hypothetical protein